MCQWHKTELVWTFPRNFSGKIAKSIEYQSRSREYVTLMPVRMPQFLKEILKMFLKEALKPVCENC